MIIVAWGNTRFNDLGKVLNLIVVGEISIRKFMFEGSNESLDI